MVNRKPAKETKEKEVVKTLSEVVKTLSVPPPIVEVKIEKKLKVDIIQSRMDCELLDCIK